MMDDFREDVTQNLYRFYREISGLCGYISGQICGLDYVWNQNGSWPSYILGTPGSTDIPEIVHAIERKEIPAFWIMEQTPDFEMNWLEERGVRIVREWKGMVLDTIGFEHIPPDHGIDLRTNDPETQQDWLGIVNTELMRGAMIGEEVLASISTSEAFRWIVAYLDDQPVGAGLSYTEEGVTGLYMIVTKASYRGMGIGTLITSNLIKSAKQAGIGTIVLHATKPGERIYENIGFGEKNRLSVLWYIGT
ncbi:MAG: GNAT family N-acetyltransferase [Bacteroidales bacterium]|nr:GNAT family N-acetyltransferase [Bacteroidales bacterium]